MSVATTFQIELHEPDITITSNQIRWAIIRLIERENALAKINHGVPEPDEYAVTVRFVARRQDDGPITT